MTEQNPLFSIIIPVFHSLSYLKTCIRSIENQIFSDFEVIIVNGGTDNATNQFLQTLPPPFSFISERDSGIYDAMNKGVYVSKGALLYFMGADDIFASPTVLEQVALQFDHDSDFYFGDILLGKNKKKSSYSHMLWLKNTLHHQALFYQRYLFDDHFYDTTYKILSDYHFNLKLFIKGKKGKKIDVIVANCGAFGVSKNYNEGLYQEERLLKRNLATPIYYPFIYVLTRLKSLLKTRSKG